MNYNMLENEIIKLQDEEFGLQMLGDVTVILAKARDIYLSDFKRRLDTKDKYDYIVSLVINLLMNKISTSELGITEPAINNLINSIKANTLIIDNVRIIDEIVLLTGKEIFNPHGEEVSRIFDARLRDVTSYEFTDFCKKITYFNSPVGRKVIERLVHAINNKLKEFFKSDKDPLLNIDGNIVYNVPMISIYATAGLNTICNDIFNNDEAKFKLVVKKNIEEIYVFEVDINKEKISINELEVDVLDLANTEKKKTLHK